MTVLLLHSAPQRLRGMVTRWLCQVATNTYIGNLSRREHDRLCQLIEMEIGDGGALVARPGRLGRTDVRPIKDYPWLVHEIGGVLVSARRS